MACNDDDDEDIYFFIYVVYICIYMVVKTIGKANKFCTCKQKKNLYNIYLSLFFVVNIIKKQTRTRKKKRGKRNNL